MIICTRGRRGILHTTVTRLALQTQTPRHILLGVCDDQSVLPETAALPGVEVVNSSRKGTSAQRNACIERVTTPYAFFIDDDVELASGYIKEMENLFENDSEVVAAMGELVADGARKDTGYTHSEAVRIIDRYVPNESVSQLGTAISCSTFVRASIFQHVRFDERLPLYGWLEDMDFSTQAKRFGKLVKNSRTCSVHLGVSFGRTSGVRFGYSQIANPFYLWKKSGQPSFGRMLINFWLRLVLANLVYAVLQRGTGRVDRQGRLKGNILAFWDLLLSRMEPERILGL